jgi:hypothetical protein
LRAEVRHAEASKRLRSGEVTEALWCAFFGRPRPSEFEFARIARPYNEKSVIWPS